MNLMEPEDHIIIAAWRLFRSGGMGGPGHLPFAGGSLQQPAALMQALEAMSGAEAALGAFKRVRPSAD